MHKISIEWLGNRTPAAHEMDLHDQSAVRGDHPERAPGHPELTVRRCGHGLDLELAVQLAHLSVELERDRAVAGRQIPADSQCVALESDGVGDESQLRVVLSIEEGG